MVDSVGIVSAVVAPFAVVGVVVDIAVVGVVDFPADGVDLAMAAAAADFKFGTDD